MDLRFKTMIRRYDQVHCYSPDEYRRRLTMTLSLMHEKNVDLLWIVDPGHEGYTAYYTGQYEGDHLWILSDGSVYVIFGNEVKPFETADAYLSKQVIVKKPQTLVDYVTYVSGIDPAFLLGHCPNGNIGMIHEGSLNARVCHILEDKLPRLEPCSMDVCLGMKRAVKSDEEIRLIHETVSVYEKLFRACPVIFRRERLLRDCVIDIRDFAHNMGAGGDVQLFSTNAGLEDHGQYCDFGLGITDWPTPKLQDGMRIFMLMESNSYGGHYVAIGRNFVFGKPHKETQRIFDAALKMQRFAAERFVPGNTLKQIFDENYAYITSLGFLTNEQNYMHGMGTCPGEMPMTHDGATENEPLQTNMHLLIHPHVRFDRGADTGKLPYDEMYNIDTFFVSPEGGIRANDLPSDMIIL